MILSGLTKSTTIYSYGLYSCFRHNFVRQTNTHWVAFGEPLLSFQNASAEKKRGRPAKVCGGESGFPTVFRSAKCRWEKSRSRDPYNPTPSSAQYVLSWKNTTTSSCISVFENHRKSLIIHCELSELRLHLEWTKIVNLAIF